MINPKKLARQFLPAQFIKLVERTYRRGRGLFWRAVYFFPASGQRVIAVTGTNGKTTTASYVNRMFRENGLKTAVYTTAFIEIDGERIPNRTHMTVTSQAAIQRFFARARRAGVDWIILEITSHALHQERVAGVKVEIAVITNLSQEHLDYHKDMESYAAAKALLLQSPYSPKWCILNADDEWFDFFRTRSSGKVLSFGAIKEADLRLSAYKLSPQGSSLTVNYQGAAETFTSQLIGKFNAYNAIAAYGVGVAAGLERKQVSKGLAKLESVPGRMERVDAGQDFNVIVDYAITPDAMEKVLGTLREMTEGKVAVVFGATGDRDKTKRQPMGEIAGRLADRVYLTDDETYTEDPSEIRAQVYEGIKAVKAEKRTKVIDDRRRAIKQAFEDARSGDTVLLTGIGHQDYRNMGGKKKSWDEREVARKILQT